MCKKKKKKRTLILLFSYLFSMDFLYQLPHQFLGDIEGSAVCDLRQSLLL